ncbi:MAG: Asp-tRNA(Asn)/Glu-tRNA(Gln) amidotransferase subunit GatB [Candidatus Scalindua sp. AMX11]|nr:MAG: Asp-tRNA(Asn)/Glu-tRNA(Gln) amidotransferase subunit GatB [Candidatus Scalindua sp.]RZV71444.1 MAG: Asp-tRNA(Asn)/Glu-tRNA(Gln) amidotransferase subunit GatB [Candidatus Scalindua sp. SCAELEC01]TDE64292.1 MAG: Asp-tRNA(Asn)/Glu-tRNA(Gln) amidotransferase subunit GatB [Candidatus Scalindua sp. AMX11]GJQ59932.1 MAG: aspartyl/glutamyl-tRNA(Asn/Gln) amidotransferase subunit B [Candidatus Scalindua sp.]
MEYDVVIGLETHAELDTDTKLFCGCSTAFGSEPNTQTCPVCLALPGVLPVINRKAFEHTVKTALALNCEINNFVNFDRKNYYYPDLPKNYQISQNYFNLGNDGFIELNVKGKKNRIGIHNVHLEEDAGKLVHPEASDASYSLIDFNRAGVPLVEIVTKPDMRCIDEVEVFMHTLRNILLYIGVSDCKMQEGSLRFEASISLCRKGAQVFGNRVEIKNLNSMKAVLKVLAYEISRQRELLERGEQIVMETRLWDEISAVSRRMRLKEESHDYRYFPEPDLVPILVDKKNIESIRMTIPELPTKRHQRFVSEYLISEYDAGILTESKSLSDYFEECVKLTSNSPKELTNWIINDVLRVLNEKKKEIQDFNISPKMLVELIEMKSEIGGAIAKEVFSEMSNTGKDAPTVVREKNLKPLSNTAELSSLVSEIIGANPKAVEDYGNGKESALSFLVGQSMKVTKGKANPKTLLEIFKEKLANSP